MDFTWTPEQLALQESVRDFGRQSLAEPFEDAESAGILRRDAWRRCAEFGVLGLCIPEEYGGSGFDPLTAVGALEALGYACRDNGLLFALNAQMWAVQAPVLRFGTPEQRERYLPPMVRGEWIGAHGMTEPGSGSESFALKTMARRDGDRYVLAGSKTFVSNAPDADVVLVFATGDPRRGFMGISAFLVDRDAPGLRIGRPIEKMGLRTAPMSEVFLEDCRIPVSQRLGREGNGGTIFKHSMTWERCCILATCLGTMAWHLERAVDYANTRRAFGHPIGAYQAISHRIAEMRVRLEAARFLLYRAAWQVARGDEAAAEIAMAKLAVSEGFVQSSLDVIQIYGGYGYAAEYGFERDLRDAIGSRIYSGTSEIQREIVAQATGVKGERA
jgi:alkylation response protein AidB-like acyl-CoA dehydrogenase